MSDEKRCLTCLHATLPDDAEPCSACLAETHLYPHWTPRAPAPPSPAEPGALKNTSTPEGAAYWASLDRNHQMIVSWPAAKSGRPPAPEPGAMSEIGAELAKARSKHGPMRGAHEGYAVLLEELDELWDEVKKRTPDMALMRKEAIQVGAMAARFVEDVCGAPEPSAREGQGADEVAPCGGSRCFRSPETGAWIHSSKSYSTCSARHRDQPAGAGTKEGG